MKKQEEEMEFYDVKSKAKFKTMEWEVRAKDVKGKPRYFAVAKSNSGDHECWRVISKVKAQELGAAPADE